MLSNKSLKSAVWACIFSPLQRLRAEVSHCTKAGLSRILLSVLYVSRLELQLSFMVLRQSVNWGTHRYRSDYCLSSVYIPKQGLYWNIQALLSIFKVPKPKISRLLKPLPSQVDWYYECNYKKIVYWVFLLYQLFVLTFILSNDRIVSVQILRDGWFKWVIV